MKRIKRILCLLIVFISVIILSGCGNSYSSVTYSRFTEKLSDELGFTVTDNSLSYEGIYERALSAVKDDALFNYYEFSSSKEAKEFVKKRYEKKKNYSYKSYDDYSVVKYSKTGYIQIIQVDNIVITGSTEKDSKKSEIKKVFKELGY